MDMEGMCSLPACGTFSSIGYRAAGPSHGMIVCDHDNAMQEHLLVGGGTHFGQSPRLWSVISVHPLWW